MIFEPPAIEHALNQLRREINTEFPAFTAIIISCEAGQEHEALKSKQAEIMERTGGVALYEHLSAMDSPATAMIAAKKRKFPYLTAEPKFLSALFIDPKKICEEATPIFLGNELNDGEDETLLIQKDIRKIAYQSLWPALSLWRGSLEKDLPLDIEKDIVKAGHIYTLRDEPLLNGKRDLLAESFACLCMELSGAKSVGNMALKAAAASTLEAKQNHIPEDHPFPIAFDAIKLMSRHIKENRDALGFFENTLLATAEIDDIFDELAIEKWQEFARKAQEMIWRERTPQEVLGAASYSTEDAYIRSYASILAELLNTDLTPIKNTDQYNPFGAQDQAETRHIKRAEELFSSIVDQVLLEETPELFLQHAEKQIHRFLLKGQITGWCAPALIEAHMAYKMALENPKTDDASDVAKQMNRAFHAALRKTMWQDLQDLHTVFMSVKRQNGTVLRHKIKEHLAHHKTLSCLFEYF